MLLAEVSDLVGQWLPVQTQPCSAHPKQIQDLATRALKLVLLQAAPQVGRHHAAAVTLLNAAQHSLQWLQSAGTGALQAVEQRSNANQAVTCVEEMLDSLEALTSTPGISPGLAKTAKALVDKLCC